MNDIQAYIDSLAEKYKVPAISVAVWQDDKLYSGASGVLNISTGIRATTDSIFQIGSIGKVFTATLIMQLVDAGKINLDYPVISYLRDFHVACDKATESITVRQLLCHTSGISGPFFPEDRHDQGSLISRYVDQCYLASQIHKPGDMFSYSNAGYCIAGRLVEVMTGLSWYEAIEEMIVKPLGMKNVAVSPNETPRFRTAIGHIESASNKAEWIPASQCYFPLSMAPAGTSLATSPSELIHFAKAHLNAGLMLSGEQLLSKESIYEMQSSQIKLPSYSEQFMTDFGLGWALVEGGNAPMYGHDGVTIGQSALLRIIPSHNLIVAVFVNGGRWPVIDFLSNLFRDLMRELIGINFDHHKPCGFSANPEHYCGRYESRGSTWDIRFKNGVLVANTCINFAGEPSEILVLKRIGEDSFVGYSDSDERKLNMSFLGTDRGGCPKYLFVCYELCIRIS